MKVDITDILNDFENKIAEMDIIAWADSRAEKPFLTETVATCAVCGVEKGESDMLKLFRTWTNGSVTTNKGICKRCWNYDEREEI